MTGQQYPTFRRFTPHELRLMIEQGRIIDFVPNAQIQATPLGPHHVQLEWPAGPRGHALIGQCPDGCHTVVEYPRQWRSRGHEIAESLLAPEPIGAALREHARRLGITVIRERPDGSLEVDP